MHLHHVIIFFRIIEFFSLKSFIISVKIPKYLENFYERTTSGLILMHSSLNKETEVWATLAILSIYLCLFQIFWMKNRELDISKFSRPTSILCPYNRWWMNVKMSSHVIETMFIWLKWTEMLLLTYPSVCGCKIVW